MRHVSACDELGRQRIARALGPIAGRGGGGSLLALEVQLDHSSSSKPVSHCSLSIPLARSGAPGAREAACSGYARQCDVMGEGARFAAAARNRLEDERWGITVVLSTRVVGLWLGIIFSVCSSYVHSRRRWRTLLTGFAIEEILSGYLFQSVYVALTSIPEGELLTGFAMRSDPNVVFG